jgi:hypothetical protein
MTEHFASSRDFFYLAALLTGAALGSLFNRWRRRATGSFRNLSLSLCFILLSGAVAALAVSLVYSGGGIFVEKGLYLPLTCLGGLSMLALRFPRAAGFPLILLGGLAAVWLGFSWWRLPLLGEEALVRVTNEGSARYVVQVPGGGTGGPGEERRLSFGGDENTLLWITLTRLAYHRFIPLIGGEVRGSVTEIALPGETLLSEPRPGMTGGVPREGPGAVLLAGREDRQIRGSLLLGLIAPGMSMDAVFEGDTLAFR